MDWPGWPAFTDPGSGSTLGLRYRTLTFSGYWYRDNGHGGFEVDAFVGSLSVDQLNGVIIEDNLTTIEVPAKYQEIGGGWAFANIAIGDPNNVITQDKLTFPGGGILPDVSISLSNPFSLLNMKNAAVHSMLFITGGVDIVQDGQAKLATWDRGDGHSDPGSNAPPWLSATLFSSTNPAYFDPVTGGYKLYYAWGSTLWLDEFNSETTVITKRPVYIDGAPAGYDEFWPFAMVPRRIVLDDFGPVDASAGACQGYSQVSQWFIDQLRIFDATADACVTTTVIGIFGVGDVVVGCEITKRSPDGTIRISAPDVAADVGTSDAITCKTPLIGGTLTGGGCPCIPPLHEEPKS